MAYRDIIIADSPAIYLELEETSGNPTNSGSESIASFTVGAGVTRNITGKYGKGWDFDGTNTAYVQINDAESKYSDKIFSVEFWVKTGFWSETIASMDFSGTRKWIAATNASGQILFQIFGSSTTVSLTGGAALWDGLWHHAVYVGNGGTDHKLYLDGTLIDSSTNDIGTFNPGGLLTLGMNNNDSVTGSIDEFAVYNSALTSLQVSTHYAATANVSPTIAAMTATAAMPTITIGLEPVISVPVMTATATMTDTGYSYTPNVAPATADATMPNASGLGNVRRYWVTSEDASSTGGTGQARLNSALSYYSITFDVSDINYAVSSAVLSLHGDRTVDAGIPVVYERTSSGAKTGTALSATIDGDVWNYDMSALVSAWDEGTKTNYGVRMETITSGSTTDVYMSNYTDPAQIPLLTVVLSNTAPAESVNFEVPVATASATIVAAVPSTEILPDVLITVEPMLASAEITSGNFFDGPVFAVANAMVGDAEMVDSTVTVNSTVNFAVLPATSTGFLVPPFEAINDSDDPYYQRLAAQMGDEDSESHLGNLWFRLDETSGPDAINRLGVDGIFRGSPTFGNFGPEGRRVVTFDGVDDYIGMPDSDFYTNRIRFEFVFRTDKATQIIARGNDYKFGMFGGTTTPTNQTGLEMIDGKLRIIPTTGPAFTGRTRLDDNVYHHVSVTVNQSITSVYIDGVLEFRRFNSFSLFTVPDSIGGGPSFVDGAFIGTDDPSLYFRGDIMEFVVDLGNPISERELVHNYYAVFGIVPIAVPAATATATMPDAKGKGNQPRALALFSSTSTDTDLSLPNYTDRYNWAGLRTRGVVSGGGGMINLNDINPSGTFDMAGYKVFPKSIIADEFNVGDYTYDYYDQVTGEQEFINLVEDIDLSDYDLVFFINLPASEARVNANDFELVPAFDGRFQGMFDRMMDSLADAQRLYGFSIWAPQPEVALGLGIISDFDAHSMLRGEPGGPVTPFGKPGTGDFDTRALNKQRLVSTVDGLTDFGGWILEDYIFGFGPTNGANYQPPNEAWNYVERPNGLLIGDSIFYPQDFYDASGSASWFSGHNQRRTVISVPQNSVLAGTVVTREVATYYDFNTLTDNPWMNNAVSIIVKPGDNMKGKPVGGKIYVNFMDSIDGQTPLFKQQLVPPNGQIPLQSQWETPEMREWEYSSSRVQRVGQSVSGATVNVGTPDLPAAGDAAAWATYQYQLTLSNMQKSGTIIVVNENESYPVTYLPHYPMISRAFNWLHDREVLEPGDQVVRTTPATATAEMESVSVIAQADTVIAVAVAVANATIVNPDEVDEPDVSVLVLPMSASAEMTGYGKNIGVEPMTATAEMVENFDLVHAGGEQVVLYLNYTDAIVYLKEDI